jgi:hypothetical protein
MGVGRIVDLLFYLLQRGIELQRLELRKNRRRPCGSRARDADAEETHGELPQGGLKAERPQTLAAVRVCAHREGTRKDLA